MNKKKILIVDDESRMRKLIKDFLKRTEYDVLEAATGKEAVDIFYDNKDIDLILLDVMLPELDGDDVLSEIRTTSAVPIIMLTAKSDEKD